jgi:hypothetical protein
MKLNSLSRRESAITHEGGPAASITPAEELTRTVLACLLWEDSFYEDGQSVADRIDSLCDRVSPEFIASLAITARHHHNLRHAPLLLLCNLARRGSGAIVSDTICEVIARADEMAELLAIYWRSGRRPLSNPMRRGIAKAFAKFSEYQLAKYAGKKSDVTLRDVMFLCHPKPTSDDQARVFMQIANGTLPPPETWEVLLSAGSDKKSTFESLIREGKLGYLALLRNLRNMMNAGCDLTLVREAIVARKGADKVLPFRYIAAARAVPSLEPLLDEAMMASTSSMPQLSGQTIVLVDVSASMHAELSARGDMSRLDAAAGLASIINAEDLRVFSFSNRYVEVPPRKGMSGIDAISSSQENSGTYLGAAVTHVNTIPHDRLIVITDEQSSDYVPPPVCRLAYMINVANFSKGVGYRGGWTHIDGFSEHVLKFISESEGLSR